MSRLETRKVTYEQKVTNGGPGAGYMRISNIRNGGGGSLRIGNLDKLTNGSGYSRTTVAQKKPSRDLFQSKMTKDPVTYGNGGYLRITNVQKTTTGSGYPRVTTITKNVINDGRTRTTNIYKDGIDKGYSKIRSTTKKDGGYPRSSDIKKTTNSWDYDSKFNTSPKYTSTLDDSLYSTGKRNWSSDIKNGYSTNGPFCVQQRPWTPTKRRGPISAEFITPGPADITLPSTFGPQQKDNTRSKSPAFTFAGKHEGKVKFLTPGPGSYEVSGVVRTGKEVPSGPTISGRLKEPEPYKTPAPGDYTPEKCEKTVLNVSPSFTFGSKAKDAKPDTIPAPGAYDPEKSTNSVLTTKPSYSFGIKHKDLKIENIPAPGTYSPEKSEKALNNAPSYTFGGKFKDPKPDDVPAPNSYNIPEITEGPSYTIGGKDGNLWASNKNPGPGSYNIPGAEICKQKSPAFTISAKTTLPGDKTKKPGPGTHSPEKVVMRHTPSFTFGIRHSPFAHGFGDKNKSNGVQQKTVAL